MQSHALRSKSLPGKVVFGVIEGFPDPQKAVGPAEIPKRAGMAGPLSNQRDWSTCPVSGLLAPLSGALILTPSGAHAGQRRVDERI